MKTEYLAFGAQMEQVDSGIETYEVTHDAAIVKVIGDAGAGVQTMKKGEQLYVLGDIGEAYCFVITRDKTGYFPKWALSSWMVQ